MDHIDPEMIEVSGDPVERAKCWPGCPCSIVAVIPPDPAMSAKYITQADSIPKTNPFKKEMICKISGQPEKWCEPWYRFKIQDLREQLYYAKSIIEKRRGTTP